MQTSIPLDDQQPSVLTMLRSLAAPQRLTLRQAVQFAELQAAELRYAVEADDDAFPMSTILLQPEIMIERDFAMPPTVSGVCTWSQRYARWVITLNGQQPATRQRFSILHEYKHILDHGWPELCGVAGVRCYGHTPTEFLAEYFAGCVLVPRPLLSRCWVEGLRDPYLLAQQFRVSERAIEVRLEQLGLTRSHGGCGRTLAAMAQGAA